MIATRSAKLLARPHRGSDGERIVPLSHNTAPSVGTVSPSAAACGRQGRNPVGSLQSRSRSLRVARLAASSKVPEPARSCPPPDSFALSTSRLVLERRQREAYLPSDMRSLRRGYKARPSARVALARLPRQLVDPSRTCQHDAVSAWAAAARLLLCGILAPSTDTRLLLLWR